MILPSKKLRPENSLIYLGGTVLKTLGEPRTVSGVWQELKEKQYNNNTKPLKFTYDWFVLSLDLLFTMGALEFYEGKLHKRSM
jgi:hypothetical protein